MYTIQVRSVKLLSKDRLFTTLVHSVMPRLSILLVAPIAALSTPRLCSRATTVSCSAVIDTESSLWKPLTASLATDVGSSFTLREGLVPSSAPQPTLSIVRPALAPADKITLYRDTNAWCPFCERVWIQLMETGEEFETVLIDISADKKPHWYKDAVPTGQTPSACIDGNVVWESVDIMQHKISILVGYFAGVWEGLKWMNALTKLRPRSRRGLPCVRRAASYRTIVPG